MRLEIHTSSQNAHTYNNIGGYKLQEDTVSGIILKGAYLEHFLPLNADCRLHMEQNDGCEISRKVKQIIMSMISLLSWLVGNAQAEDKEYCHTSENDTLMGVN